MKKKLVLSLAGALVVGAIATSGSVSSIAAEVATALTIATGTDVATATDIATTTDVATGTDIATSTDVATATDVSKETIKVTTKFKTIKASKLKKNNQTFTIKTDATGDVTFKKVSGDKKITVAKNGKVTVKKGLKKGTYTLKVKVTGKNIKTTTGKVKVVVK